MKPTSLLPFLTTTLLICSSAIFASSQEQLELQQRANNPQLVNHPHLFHQRSPSSSSSEQRQQHQHQQIRSPTFQKRHRSPPRPAAELESEPDLNQRSFNQQRQQQGGLLQPPLPRQTQDPLEKRLRNPFAGASDSNTDGGNTDTGATASATPTGGNGGLFGGGNQNSADSASSVAAASMSSASIASVASASQASLASLSAASVSRAQASSDAAQSSLDAAASKSASLASVASASRASVSSLSAASQASLDAAKLSASLNTVVQVTSTVSQTPTPTSTSDKDSSSSDSSDSNHTPLIIGVSVVGGVAVLGAAIFLYMKFGGKRFSGYEDDDTDIKWPELKTDGDTAAMQPLPARRTGGAGFAMGDEFSDNGHGSQDGDGLGGEQMTSQYHDGSIVSGGIAGAGSAAIYGSEAYHQQRGDGALEYGGNPRDSMTFGGSQIALSAGAGTSGYPVNGQSGPGYYEDGGYAPPPPANAYYGASVPGYEGQDYDYSTASHQPGYAAGNDAHLYGGGQQHGETPMHNPYG